MLLNVQNPYWKLHVAVSLQKQNSLKPAFLEVHLWKHHQNGQHLSLNSAMTSMYELSSVVFERALKILWFYCTFCDHNLDFTTGSFWAIHHSEIFSFPLFFDVTATDDDLHNSSPNLPHELENTDVTTSNNGTMSIFIYFIGDERCVKHSEGYLVVTTCIYKCSC